MEQITLDMEAAGSFMDQCFYDWAESCRYLKSAPDLDRCIADAEEAHARFLLARKRYTALLEEYKDMIAKARRAAMAAMGR